MLFFSYVVYHTYNVSVCCFYYLLKDQNKLSKNRMIMCVQRISVSFNAKILFYSAVNSHIKLK